MRWLDGITEGDQPWDFFGGNDAEAETPVLWPPHAKSGLIGKDSDAGRDWGQEEKGTTEDEMAGWHGGSADKSCLALAAPWTVAHQAPLSMGFPRQYWSGLPFPSLGDLPDSGTEPTSLSSPTPGVHSNSRPSSR